MRVSSDDLYERGLRPLTHPWEFPDRIRWPRPTLFPRWDRFRADVKRREYDVRYSLAKRLAPHDVR